MLVQPFSTVRSSFCSVNSSFLLFVWVLIDSLKFFTVLRAFDRFLEVSCCLRGFQSVGSELFPFMVRLQVFGEGFDV